MDLPPPAPASSVTQLWQGQATQETDFMFMNITGVTGGQGTAVSSS